jgi:hypothetical protein
MSYLVVVITVVDVAVIGGRGREGEEHMETRQRENMRP